MRWDRMIARGFVVAVGVMIPLSGSLAQEVREEETEVTQPQVKRVEPPFQLFGAKTQKLRVGYVQGVDNNVELDSGRKGDTFSQENVDLSLMWPIIDKISLLFEDDFTNINYYEVTDANLLNNVATLSVAAPYTDNVRLKASAYHDFTWRPRNTSNTYNEFGGRWTARHRLMKQHYQEYSYTLSHRWYYDNKARQPSRLPSDDEREDVRNTLAYEVGLRAAPKTMVKWRHRYYHNSSNDQFNDYHDYWSYRMSVSFYQSVTKELLALVGFHWEHRDYEDRRIPEAKDTSELDNLWTGNLALVYSLTPNLSLNYSYTYRQNSSNDPRRDYSGAVNTVGLHYTF